MTADEFLRHLDPDQEGPHRAIEFRSLVREGRRSTSARILAREIYGVAGSGTWPSPSIHDVNMLIYSLADNPELVPEVAADVERLLREVCFTTNPLWQSWKWIKGHTKAS